MIMVAAAVAPPTATPTPSHPPPETPSPAAPVSPLTAQGQDCACERIQGCHGQNNDCFRCV